MKKILNLLTITIVLIFSLSLAPEATGQIEVINEKRVKVTAFGKSNKGRKKTRIENATRDALYNAVEQVVDELIRDQEEKVEYNKIKSELFGDPYKWVSDHKITKSYREGKYHHVGLWAIVNKSNLEQKLVGMGLITHAKDTRKALDRFTIMPYLDLSQSDREAIEWKELFYTRVRMFFEEKGIPTVGQDEIMAAEGDEEMLARLKSSTAEEDEEDPALQIARNTPADIFVKIVGKIETGDYRGNKTKKVVITVGAYTVMTGEFIGSGQGFSEPLALSSEGASVAAGIDQAMNSGMTTLMDRMTMFWREFIKEGRPIKLIFTDFNFGEIGQIREILQGMCNDQKRLKGAGNVTEYMVWYDGSPEDLMYEFYDAAQLQGKLKEDPSLISNTIRFYRMTE